jgi:hypothetical protein
MFQEVQSKLAQKGDELKKPNPIKPATPTLVMIFFAHL